MTESRRVRRPRADLLFKDMNFVRRPGKPFSIPACCFRMATLILGATILSTVAQPLPAEDNPPNGFRDE